LDRLPVKDGLITEKDWTDWIASECDAEFLAHMWRNVLLKDEDAAVEKLKIKPTNKALSAPQQERATELFKKLDKDDSGLLEEEEIGVLRGGDLTALKGLNTDAMGRVDPASFTKWLETVKKGKGDAYLRHFMNTLENNAEPLSSELFDLLPHEAHETFETIDKDRQGFITKDELVRAHGGDHTLFERMDVDRNNRIDKLEWSRFCFELCSLRGEVTHTYTSMDPRPSTEYPDVCNLAGVGVYLLGPLSRYELER